MNPNPTLQALADAGAANITAARSLVLSALALAERLSSVNLEFARASLEHGADTTQIDLRANNWQDSVARQNGALREAAERTSAWFRDVCEAVTEVQATTTEAASARIGELSDAWSELLDRMIEGSPMGSTPAVDAVRSALAGNRLAYDNIVGMTRRMTEANVAAVSDAVKAMAAPVQVHKANNRKAA